MSYGCAVCDQTFISLDLFDAHQEVDYSTSPAVSCKDPEAMGLVQAHTDTWMTPEGLKSLTEKLAAMAEGRRQKALAS